MRSFSDWQKALLVGLARADRETDVSRIELKVVAEEYVGGFERGWIRKAAATFRSRGWAEIHQFIGGGDDGEIYATLTGEGLAAAEEILSSDADVLERVRQSFGAIPAADRVVRLDDNAPGRAEALRALNDIEAGLASGSNTLPLTADERIVILSEMKPLSDGLRRGIVRIGALIAALAPVGGLLPWVADKLAGHALTSSVDAAVGALSALLRALGV